MEQGADLHMAQLMPLPLTVSCFSKIQIGFAFLVPAHPGSPGQRAVKRVCVCVLIMSRLYTAISQDFMSVHFDKTELKTEYIDQAVIDSLNTLLAPLLKEI